MYFRVLGRQRIIQFIAPAFAGILVFLFANSAVAALAFRNKTFATVTSSATSKVLTEPASAAQNDIFFLFAVFDSAPTVTTPTGWTLLYTIDGTATRTVLYWIRRGASAPTLTINFTSCSYAEFSITAWSGAETSGSPIHKQAANPTAYIAPAEPDPPSVTTTIANTLVIAFGMTWVGWNTTATAPSGYTLREGGVNGNNNDIGVASKALASAATENPGKFTGVLNPTYGRDVGEITIVLKEPGAASAPPIRHRVIQN